MAKIQIRRDTSSNWATANPVLSEGELAYVTDTNTLKIGDGTNNYANICVIAKSNPIDLTDVSVCTNSASGSGALTYDNTTGQFSFTPADIGSCFTNGSICNLYITGTLCGPSTLTIDPAAHGDNTGTVVIAGNLQVDGITTTVNSCTLEVADKNIVLACGSSNAAASDGAGITADLGSDGSATLTYSSGNDRWEMNKSLAASVIGNVTGQVSDISNHSTTDLAEGTNLYYTDARADARIAASPGDNQKVFVATGAISAGEVVGLRNDGTVEVVTLDYSTTQNVGTELLLHNSAVEYVSTIFDPSQNKVVIVYADGGNNYYGTAVVGTVSGTSITFGTPVVFNTGARSSRMTTIFDPSQNKIVIGYQDWGNNYYGTAVVGTVSGTSITFGTPVVFESDSTLYLSAAFDSNSNKVVIAYGDSGNGTYGTAVVGTVSGTSISFGTPVVFQTSNVSDITATFDSNSNKVVIAYTDGGSNYSGKAIVGTVSGTSISFGTAVIFRGMGVIVLRSSATFDSNSNKVVIAYRHSFTGNYNLKGEAVVGTVSGTSISFGTPVVFISSGILSISALFDSNSNKIIIAYDNQSVASRGTVITGTVSGTSITFGTPLNFSTSVGNFPSYISAAIDTSQSGKVVIGYKGSSSNAYAIVYDFAATNADSWIGIAAENIADTATGLIDLPGAVNRSQTGLTTNSIYYVDSDGSVTTTPTIYGKIGQAYSATELQISDISNHSTTDLAEGTNLYYTDARADARADARIAASPGDNQKVFVATGAISAGNVVSLKNDGTVENTVLATVITSNSAGTPVAFNSTSSGYITTAFDSNSGQVIVAHSDSGVYGTGSKAGTVTGNSITFGSSASFESAFVWYSVMSFDSNTNQVVIAFKDNNNSGIGTAVVGTVSGTSISYGSHTTFNGGNILTTISNTFDSNSNKTVVGFRDYRGKGYARVGTVSGTSISFGTDAIFDNTAVTNITSTFDSNQNKVVMAYTNSSGHGAAAVGNISGTNITFGTPVVFSSASTSSISATFDTNTNKVVISYSDGGNNSYGTAIVGTVSGTTISFGTPEVFSEGSTSSISSTFDSNTNKVVIAYTDGSNNSYGTAIDGSVSGTTIGFGTPNVFNNVSTSAISASFDSSNNKTVIAYRDGTNNSYGTALVYQSEVTQLQTNADSWIGIAAENIADTATGLIDLPGALNRSQSGLTANSIYYVASDGSLTTTATQYGKIGRAYSATELQVFESYKQLNFASQLIFGN